MARPNNGPYIPERTNPAGFWEICWSENGRSRRRSSGCKDLGEAKKVLAAFILGFDGVKKDSEKPSVISIARCIADYYREHVLKKVVDRDTQFYNFKAIAQHFCGFAIANEFTAKDAPEFFAALAVHPGGYTPPEVTPALVESYEAARRAGRYGRKATNGGIRRELQALVTAFNHANKMRGPDGQKRLKADDMPAIVMPEEPLPRDRWLTDEERDRLLAACLPAGAQRLPRVYLFTALALGTAGRKEALETLTWFQVDLQRRVINLNPAGRRQTKKRRGNPPIATWLLPILERARRETSSEYVLGHGGSIRTAFENACDRAKLTGVTPHVLRHTWATRAAQNGVPMWKIAAVLGDRIETVMRRYLHHCPDDLRDAIDHWGIGRGEERETESQ